MLSMRLIIPAGGALLAIALLILAFIASDGLRPKETSARTEIKIELDDRPEWRQFIILSAIRRRADELNRLLEPDYADSQPAAPELAGVSKDHNFDPKNNVEIQMDAAATATVSDNVREPASIENTVAPPPETGVFTPTEFPAAAAPEKEPSAIRTPKQIKRRNVHRHTAAAAKRKLSPPQNAFEAPFGNQMAKQTPAINRNDYFGNRQVRQAPTAPTVTSY